MSGRSDAGTGRRPWGGLRIRVERQSFDWLPKIKGRFYVEYVAKISNYTKRSPASSRKRLRTRALARMTEFSVIPRSSATLAACSPSTPKR